MSALTATVVAGAGRSPASSSPDTLVEAADATGGRVVVAEDHRPEGGLGSAVVAALLNAGVQQPRLAHLSVSELPRSALTPRTLHRQPPR